MRSFNILFFLFGDQIFAPFANHFNFFSLKHFTNTVFAVKSAMLFVNDKIKKNIFYDVNDFFNFHAPCVYKARKINFMQLDCRISTLCYHIFTFFLHKIVADKALHSGPVFLGTACSYSNL